MDCPSYIIFLNSSTMVHVSSLLLFSLEASFVFDCLWAMAISLQNITAKASLALDWERCINEAIKVYRFASPNSIKSSAVSWWASSANCSIFTFAMPSRQCMTFPKDNSQWKWSKNFWNFLILGRFGWFFNWLNKVRWVPSCSFNKLLNISDWSEASILSMVSRNILLLTLWRVWRTIRLSL